MPNSIDVQINRQDNYTVNLGFGLWNGFIDFCSNRYSSRKIFVAVDAKVDGLHGQKIREECGRYFQQCHMIRIPEGEKSKSIKQWERLQNELLADSVERSTPLLAVGGGVTGDLAGFAAASVLRGIPLIHMPTSLLAMVDSSIGGKTGINHAKGKNLIGAFYQPDAIFADLHYLQTLERREWINGLAEMLKYAAIRKPGMFEELQNAVNNGFQPSKQWLKLIRESASIKVNIVQKDERESGLRAFLNFGHSFAHALERLAGYGNISHGQAVFTGMLASVYISGLCGAAFERDHLSAAKSLYEVTLPNKNRIPELIEAMRTDKKVKDETIRLILLKRWGEPYLEAWTDESLLNKAWQAAFDEMRLL